MDAQPKTQEEPSLRPEDLLPPDVASLAAGMISALAAQAWIHLGLVMNPRTRTTQTDLPQARLAIDCAQALYEKASPHLEEGLRRDLRATIADLQMNFVSRSAEARPESPPAPGGSPESPSA
jgi:hypothetical protein